MEVPKHFRDEGRRHSSSTLAVNFIADDGAGLNEGFVRPQATWNRGNRPDGDGFAVLVVQLVRDGVDDVGGLGQFDLIAVQDQGIESLGARIEFRKSRRVVAFRSEQSHEVNGYDQYDACRGKFQDGECFAGIKKYRGREDEIGDDGTANTGIKGNRVRQ